MTRILESAMRGAITICAVALVSWLIFSGYLNAQEVTTRDRQNTALINQNRVLISEVKTQAADAAIDREKAAHNIQLLLDWVDTLAHQQRAENAYFRAHGIRLPVRFLTIPAPPVLEVIQAPSKKHGRKK